MELWKKRIEKNDVEGIQGNKLFLLQRKRLLKKLETETMNGLNMMEMIQHINMTI